MDDLVADLELEHDGAQQRMSDPAVYNDRRKATDAEQRLKELENPYHLAQK